MPQNIGTVVQIIGAVLDIKFPPEHLPNLLNAIEIEHEGKKLTVEVAQHIGDGTGTRIAVGQYGRTCKRTSGSRYGRINKGSRRQTDPRKNIQSAR